MRLIPKEEAEKVKAGIGHYHWKCTDGKNFYSAEYRTITKAAAAAQKHINNYPAHAEDVSVYYCEKNH